MPFVAVHFVRAAWAILRFATVQGTRGKLAWAAGLSFARATHFNSRGDRMRSRALCALAALAAASSLTSSALAVSDVYAIDIRTAPHRLLKFPVNAPAQNVVSTTATYNGFAMDFNASATTLFGITNVAAAPQVFGTIDQSTGNFTPIANVTGAGANETNWSGLSSAPDGTFYASTSGGAGLNNLYTISPTGVTTLIGPIAAGAAALNI